MVRPGRCSGTSRRDPPGLGQAERLRKFPRGLGQFPPSFLAKPRWVPAPSGDLRSYQPPSSAPVRQLIFKGSLVDPRLRATFSPAHPDRAETRSCPGRTHSDRARSARRRTTRLALSIILRPRVAQAEQVLSPDEASLRRAPFML